VLEAQGGFKLILLVWQSGHAGQWDAARTNMCFNGLGSPRRHARGLSPVMSTGGTRWLDPTHAGWIPPKWMKAGQVAHKGQTNQGPTWHDIWRHAARIPSM